MSRYYKYNPNGNKPKYVEMTEEEYREAKQEDNRWFIEFDKDCAVECEQSEYENYKKETNHALYSRRGKDGRFPELLSLEGNDIECSYNMSVFGNDYETATDETAVMKIVSECERNSLNNAVAQLSENERYILYQVVFMNRSQSDIAKEYNVTQQAMSKRYQSIRKKLADILKSK